MAISAASLGVSGTALPKQAGVDSNVVRYPEIDEDQKLTITKPGQSPWSVAKEFLGPGADDAKISKFVAAMLKENSGDYGTRQTYRKGDEFKIPPGNWFDKTTKAKPTEAQKADATKQMSKLADERAAAVPKALAEAASRLEGKDLPAQYGPAVQNLLTEAEKLKKDAQAPGASPKLKEAAKQLESPEARAALGALTDKLDGLKNKAGLKQSLELYVKQYENQEVTPEARPTLTRLFGELTRKAPSLLDSEAGKLLLSRLS